MCFATTPRGCPEPYCVWRARGGAQAVRPAGDSFTAEVKRELCMLVPAEDHCRRAQLAGLVFAAGTVELGAGGRFAVRVALTLPAATRNLLALLRPYGVSPQLRTVETAPVGRRLEVILGDRPRELQVLNEIGVLTDDYRVRLAVPRRVVRRHCCLVAFLRGGFLGCGSVSAPGTPTHVELTVESAGLAEELAELLGSTGLAFRVAERERNVACYSKRRQTAADLLALLGAHGARLRWEEHDVLGEVRGTANRQANCDEANARRAAAAGRRQVEALQRLRASGQWERLPASLKTVARLRLRYPYLSLQELAARASPPLTKSALNHRLRRLMALARRPRG